MLNLRGGCPSNFTAYHVATHVRIKPAAPRRGLSAYRKFWEKKDEQTQQMYHETCLLGWVNGVWLLQWFPNWFPISTVEMPK